MTTTTRIHMATPLYDLFAEHARPAAGPDLLQPCVVCGEKSRAGERVADLSGGRGLVHLPCVAWRVQQAGGRP